MTQLIPRFLRKLHDVLISTPTDGQVLTYETSTGKWKNKAASGGGGGGDGLPTGWTQDASDPANVATNGGGLNLDVGTLEGTGSAQFAGTSNPDFQTSFSGDGGVSVADNGGDSFAALDPVHGVFSASTDTCFTADDSAGATVALDAGALLVSNVQDPSDPQDAATKGYADTAVAALSAVYQPLDSDLTAIAALATTAFGRGLLVDADAAALRSSAGLGTAATHPATDFDSSGAAAAAQAASQPVDSDLTAIAALTTTSYGRAFLALADAAAGRTALGLGTLATQSGTFSGTSSGTNTGDQNSVSGNAGTATALATSRTIDGQGFDGTANITVIAPGTHAASGKTTPADADELTLVDSAASNVLKKLTWANLKATLKTYFDTLYLGGTASAGGDLTGSYPNPTLATAGPGATGPIGDATHVATVSIDAKGRVTGLSSVGITAPASPGGLGVYGDGSDGTVTFDGSTTILGMAPSSSVYTLARDIWLAAATINNGVTIITNGFRIYCQGTLTNNGTIQWNGGAGGNGTTVGGTAGAAVGNTNGTINPSAAVGIAGVAGATGSGAGGNNSSTRSLGGAGGHGAAGSAGGGTAGTVTAPGTTVLLPRNVVQAISIAITSALSAGTIFGGASGGSGGGDGTNAGGGSGAGGGYVIVIAKILAGTGSIQARGGAGGNGSSTGNTGGGAGGGGGIVIVASSSVSAGAISGQTVDANGGGNGTSHGTGGAGITNSSAGTVILLPN